VLHLGDGGLPHADGSATADAWTPASQQIGQGPDDVGGTIVLTPKVNHHRARARGIARIDLLGAEEPALRGCPSLPVDPCPLTFLGGRAADNSAQHPPRRRDQIRRSGIFPE